jgi:hypothetical protein
LKKNTAGKWTVFAFDLTDNTAKTGDAANITANIYIDGSVNAVDDTNPTELAGGYYIFDVTAAETNGDHLIIHPDSTTSNIQVIGVPGAVWTDRTEALVEIIDPIVDSILEDTGTTLDGKIDTIDTNVDSILDDTGTSGVLLAATADSAALVDSIWDEPLTAATHNVATSAGRRLRGAGGDAIGGEVVVGTAPTTTVFDTDLTAANDVFNDQLFVMTSGSAAGQSKPIQDYANTSGVITLSEPLTVAPSDGDTFEIQPAHIHTLADTVDAMWDEPTAGHTTADTTGKALSDILVDTNATLDAKLDTIITDTNELQTDWVNGGRLDLILDAILADTAALDTDLTAVLADTNELQTDWVNGGRLDLLIDQILNDTNELQTDWVDGGRLDLLLDLASATNPTAADIADAVWDELTSGHTTAGTTGKALTDASSAGDPWSTALPGAYGSGTAGKILSDASTEITAILVDTGTTIPAALTTIDSIVDAILVDTGTDLPATLATILADTGELQTDWADGGRLDLLLDGATAPTAAQVADAVWDEPSAGHVTADTMGGDLATALAGLVSSVAGLGSVQNTITVTVNSVPKSGVDVWVTSDAAGTNVVAGTLVTDSNGQVIFWLDPGTYYVWQQLAGYNFTVPDTLVVT